MDSLAEILSSQVRSEIFRLLFNSAAPSIHLRDLQRRSGLSIGAIQKEVANLKNLDLIVSRKDGNRLYYAANPEHPLYRDLCNIVEKTSGITARLKETMRSIKGIECAFIFGSFAKGKAKAHSDIDLIVVGNIGLRSLLPKLRPLTNKFAREINPHVFSMKSWAEKRESGEHFVESIMGERKVFLVGDENVLG